MAKRAQDLTLRDIQAYKWTSKLDGLTFVRRFMKCPAKGCNQSKGLTLSAKTPKCSQHSQPMIWVCNVYERKDGRRFRYQ